MEPLPKSIFYVLYKNIKRLEYNFCKQSLPFNVDFMMFLRILLLGLCFLYFSSNLVMLSSYDPSSISLGVLFPALSSPLFCLDIYNITSSYQECKGSNIRNLFILALWLCGWGRWFFILTICGSGRWCLHV